jgi:uncharacterized protein (DUF58 family)
VDALRAESGWLTPIGLGGFILGTAIAVPLIGPAGLLALLVPLAMVSYSILLADATSERARRGVEGEVAKKNLELRDANVELRERVVELNVATVDAARQRAHGNQRDLQNTVRAFIEAIGPEPDATAG